MLEGLPMIWISSANAITDPFSPTSLANEHKTKSRSSSGYSGVPYRVQPAQHPQFRGTLQGTASTAPPINGNANVVSVRVVSVVILPDSPLAFRPHHADDPRQNDAAWVDFAGPSQGADGRCSTQGAEEPVAATQTRGAHSLEQGPG